MHLFFTSSSFNAIEVNKNVSPPQILNDNTCKTYTFITLVYESLSVATRLISFLLSWVTCDNCRESMYMYTVKRPTNWHLSICHNILVHSRNSILKPSKRQNIYRTKAWHRSRTTFWRVVAVFSQAPSNSLIHIFLS